MGVVINDRSRHVLAKIRTLKSVNLTEFVETVEEVAKQEVAILSGDLHDSIAHDNPEPGIFRVFTQTNYGGFQELGTSRMPPHPFIGPGIDVAVRDFDDRRLWQ